MPGMDLSRLGLGFHRRASGGGSEAAFTPESLFAASEAGAWYDPSDLSTLWQDTGGTVQVTADGQNVARMDDKSGNGNHATQATSGKWPVYKTSGGLHWLAFDGVDDELNFTNPVTGTSAHSVFAAVEGQEATSSTNAFVSLGDTSGNGTLRDFTDEIGLRVSFGNELYDAAVGNGVKAIVSNIAPANANVTDNRAWKNGTELGVSSSSARAMDTSTTARLGRSGAGFYAYNDFGVIIVADDKSDDRADAEAYLDEKIGGIL